MQKTSVTTLFYRTFYASCYLTMITCGYKTAAKADTAALTISSAVQQALNKNPDVMKAREARNQSDYDYSTAFARVLPTLTGTAQGMNQKDASLLANPNFGGESYNQYQLSLNLAQPLFDGGAMFAGLRFGKKDKEIKDYAVEISERTTTESVLESFYTLLLNERLLQILNDTFQVDKEVLELAERYYSVGRIQKVDLLQLKTQTSLLKPKIQAAQNQMQITSSQIATLLHDLNSTQIHTKGKLVVPEIEWVKSTAEQKKSELPEILQSRTSIDQFEDNRTIQMATFWPKLNLLGQLGRGAYTKTDLLDSNATNWSIGIQLSIPIFTGLSSFSTRDSLASQEKQMEFDETKLTDTVTVSQIQTEKSLLTAQSQLVAASEAAGYGRESLHEAERTFKLSTITYIQYQSSLQAYLDSETGFYQAKYNYIVATAQYFNAIGVPLSNLITKLETISSQAKNDD